MNILKLIPYVLDHFLLLMVIATRLGALFSTFILFRREIVNARLVISLVAILSFYVLMLNPAAKVSTDVMSLNMLESLLVQSLVGFIAGLILNIIFEVFSALGQIISMQIGLGMASLYDPRFGTITHLTHFYTYSIMLIFLFLNGHLMVIQTIMDSFTTLPINYDVIPKHILNDVFTYSAVIFSGAVQLSITIIIAILLTNIAFSVMTRFAPQFNLFSIGVGLTLILGLGFVYLTFDLFVDQGSLLVNEGLTFFKREMMSWH